MNIFFTHERPDIAASMLPFRLLVKMQVESIQMLVSACLINGMSDEDMPLVKSQTHNHKGGYTNHPCTQWVSKSSTHWDWLAKHCFFLGHYHQLHQLYKEDPIKESYAQFQLRQLLSIQNKVKNYFPNNTFTLPPRCYEEKIKNKYPELMKMPVIEGYRFYLSKKWYFQPEQYIKWQETNLTKIVN